MCRGSDFHAFNCKPAIFKANFLKHGEGNIEWEDHAIPRFLRGIVELAKGADLLILECSFPDDEAIAGHLTPSEAGEIAARAGVKRLVLTHFYPEILTTDIEAECRKTYQGDLLLATDLMSLSVG